MAEKRVVIDLGGTLIDNGDKMWRPGAKSLLAKLKEEGITPVVWTNVYAGTARSIVNSLEGFNDLVGGLVTGDAAELLLKQLGEKMVSSGDVLQIKNAEIMSHFFEPKIPAAVDCNILVDDQPDLREMAKMLGAIAIDPTPANEDTSPEQWTERVLASILANFQD
jgi:ribonucleotide monophosphatase NagD (HAD superfamily)